MATIDLIDGLMRNIYLSVETVGVDLDMAQVYRDYRTMRRTVAELRKYRPMMVALGHEFTGLNSEGNPEYTQEIIKMLEGADIIPYNTSQDLHVVTKLISDDGREGRACFDRSLLSPTVVCNIDYDPPPLKVVTVLVSTGSGLSAEEHDKLMAVPTAASNASAVINAATAAPIAANIKQVNDTDVAGSGTELDPWGPTP